MYLKTDLIQNFGFQNHFQCNLPTFLSGRAFSERKVIYDTHTQINVDGFSIWKYNFGNRKMIMNGRSIIFGSPKITLFVWFPFLSCCLIDGRAAVHGQCRSLVRAIRLAVARWHRLQSWAVWSEKKLFLLQNGSVCIRWSDSDRPRLGTAIRESLVSSDERLFA